jgi:hypothetical protein
MTSRLGWRIGSKAISLNFLRRSSLHGFNQRSSGCVSRSQHGGQEEASLWGRGWGRSCLPDTLCKKWLNERRSLALKMLQEGASLEFVTKVTGFSIA